MILSIDLAPYNKYMNDFSFKKKLCCTGWEVKQAVMDQITTI